MDINGKNALVTGGGRGIGEAISRALAENGANVAVNYLSHEECAAEMADEIKEMGNEAMTVQADISSSSDVSDMCEKVEEEIRMRKRIMSGLDAEIQELRDMIE